MGGDSGSLICDDIGIQSSRTFAVQSNFTAVCN